MFYVRPNGPIYHWRARENKRQDKVNPTYGDKFMKIINLSFDGLTHQGISLYELGDYRKAIAFFDKAIHKDNEAVVAYYYRALSRSELGQFEEAIANYDRVTNLYSDSTEVYVNRSLARIALEDYETAIQDCAEALHINPLNADAFGVRGTAKIKLGDTILGNEDLDKARQLSARWRVKVSNSSDRDVPLEGSVNHARSNDSE